MTGNLKTYLLIISSIFIGVLGSSYVIEKSKEYISTDFIRTKTIIETFKKDSIDKEVVFFGSSVCMSSIDGKALSSKNMCVLNMGSFSQNLMESVCFYQNINKKTQSIFQCMSVEDLMNDENKIPERVIKRLLFYDFGIKTETEQLLKPISTEELKIDFKNISLNTRTIPFQSLRNTFRHLYNKEFSESQTIIKNELQSPHHYVNNVSKEKLNLFIKSYGPKKGLTIFSPSQSKLDLLSRGNDFFNSKNQKYTIILMPINPAIKNYTHEYKRDLKAKINGVKHLNIIDLSTFLEREDFIDHCHINKKGRDKITEKLKLFI